MSPSAWQYMVDLVERKLRKELDPHALPVSFGYTGLAIGIVKAIERDGMLGVTKRRPDLTERLHRARMGEGYDHADFVSQRRGER